MYQCCSFRLSYILIRGTYVSGTSNTGSVRLMYSCPLSEALTCARSLQEVSLGHILHHESSSQGRIYSLGKGTLKGACIPANPPLTLSAQLPATCRSSIPSANGFGYSLSSGRCIVHCGTSARMPVTRSINARDVYISHEPLRHSSARIV